LETQGLFRDFPSKMPVEQLSCAHRHNARNMKREGGRWLL
jgi:hypothetical protein